MAQVKKFNPASASALVSFINSNSPSWVTGSGETLTIDETITITHGWQYGVTVTISRNESQLVYTDFAYSGATCVIAYDENFFYLQCWNSGNERFCVLYEKFEDMSISDARGSTAGSGTMAYQPIENFNLTDLDTSIVYNHKAVLNYDLELGHIDYTTDMLFNGTQKVLEDFNFITCSSVIAETILTFSGENYYSLGTHTLVKIDN